MATTNYNLPTISGNMSPDVVRDHNALASAVDIELKKVENKVPSEQAVTNMVQAIEGLQNGLTQHLNNNIAHNRYGVATGTNALTVTLNPAPTSLTPGMTIQFKNTTSNTGNVTINANSLGAKPLLDNLGAQLESGKLPPGMYSATYDGVNFYLTKGGGGGGHIKRIQRGTTSLTPTVSSLSVPVDTYVPSKSIIIYTIHTNNSTPNSSHYYINANTSNSTSIGFFRSASGSSVGLEIHWELIEFEESVIIQKGVQVMPEGSNAQANVTISSVNLEKSFVNLSYSTNGTDTYRQSIGARLTSSTNLALNRASNSGANSIRWAVIELP